MFVRVFASVFLAVTAGWAGGAPQESGKPSPIPVSARGKGGAPRIEKLAPAPLPPPPTGTRTLRRSSPPPVATAPAEPTADRVRVAQVTQPVSPEQAATPAAPAFTAGPGEQGTACYFSSRADGALTAGGDRLDSKALVAGHGRLPLGSRARVTNLGNGKSVEVRIVDRFPGTSGRVINLSEQAAREIGMLRAGTAQVRVEPVE